MDFRETSELRITKTPSESGELPRSSGNFILLRVSAILVLLGSPWVIYIASAYFLEGSDMANWPQTEGTITSHRVFDDSNSGETRFHVYINYKYTVQGQTYKGDRARPGANDYSQEERDKLIAKYTRGSKHTVYYAPSDPERAYLEIGMEESALVSLLMSLAMPVVGFALLGWSFPAPQNPESVGARWSSWGITLLSLFACGMMIGGATVKIFFSHLLGKGVPTGMYFVLIPLWTTGLVGVLLWSAGRVRG